MEPLVSIVMPAYNAGKYIAESIESILAQTYTHWELIIVDDESADDTKEVVAGFVSRHPRVKYIWQKNGKQGKVRNRAIHEAAGSLIAFMDADDLWLPEKLSHQIKSLNEHDVDLVFGHAYVIKGQEKTSETTGRGVGFFKGDAAVKLHLESNAFVISSVLMKASVVRSVGGFNDDLRIQYCEDWHFWLKVALAGYSMFSDGALQTYYRVHPQSASRTETRHNIKYFYAFLDLNNSFTNSAIEQQTRKRAADLVFHEKELTTENIRDICHFLEKSRIKAGAWTLLAQISFPLFRKFFNFKHQSYRLQYISL